MDLIERREAIDAIRDFFGDNDGTWSAEKIIILMDVGIIIANLPSAQPEIIQCKDCIYWWKSHKMCKRNKDKNHNCACMDCDADFYCGNAKGSEG